MLMLRVLDGFCGACSAKVFSIVGLSPGTSQLKASPQTSHPSGPIGDIGAVLLLSVGQVGCFLHVRHTMVTQRPGDSSAQTWAG